LQGVFFFCLVEISSFFLGIKGVFDANPRLSEAFPLVNTVNRLLFAVSFVALRIVWWPFVSVDFWMKAIEMLRDGSCRDWRISAVFMVSNAFMTYLQFMWGALIIKMAVRAVKGEKGKPKDAKVADAKKAH
jgi:hypothetical protein